MDTQKKSDKICVSKTVSVIALGVLFLIGVVIFSTFLGKTKTANKTRASGEQCIHTSAEACKKSGCSGLCTKGGCYDDMYQCKRPIASIPEASPTMTQWEKKFACQPYGTKFMTTSKGICWSVGSRPWKMPNPPEAIDAFYIYCGNELANDEDKSKCPKPVFCDRSFFLSPPSWSSDILNTPYKEAYMGGEKCWQTGIEVSGTEFQFGCDIFGPENIAERKQCDLSTFSCDGTYQIIDGKCYNLRNRKCSYKDLSGINNPACCSDVVDMGLCTGDKR